MPLYGIMASCLPTDLCIRSADLEVLQLVGQAVSRHSFDLVHILHRTFSGIA